MAVKKRPLFDFLKCVSCSICVQVCPVSCIVLSERPGKGDNNLYPAVSEKCIGCGTCERACPVSAITMQQWEQ